MRVSARVDLLAQATMTVPLEELDPEELDPDADGDAAPADVGA